MGLFGLALLSGLSCTTYSKDDAKGTFHAYNSLKPQFPENAASELNPFLILPHIKIHFLFFLRLSYYGRRGRDEQVPGVHRAQLDLHERRDESHGSIRPRGVQRRVG